VAFCVPNKFVVGYGLDYLERYRNLPYVGTLSFGHRREVNVHRPAFQLPPATRRSERLELTLTGGGHGRGLADGVVPAEAPSPRGGSDDIDRHRRRICAPESQLNDGDIVSLMRHCKAAWTMNS